MANRKDNRGVEVNIGDTIVWNPPYYKGILISEVLGIKKGSGLPVVENIWKRYSKDKLDTPKTGFVILEPKL